MISRFIIVAIVSLELVVSSNYTPIYTTIWSYDDVASWPGEKCQEGGKHQSPIDIRSADAIRDYEKTIIKYGPLMFIGYKGVLLTGFNNGHTIQFSSEGEAAMHPILTGGPLKYQYRMEQIHFHWVSEHAIDGQKYPMEIHFVHVRADISVSDALSRKDGVVIMSVFCSVKPELEDSQLEKTAELMQHVPKLLNTGDRISGVLLDLQKLLSPDTLSYYTYLGSLTSPECNEVVLWIIFEKPIYFTEQQYLLFSMLSNGRHNYRSLQPVRKQVVYRTTPLSVWSTPYLVGIFRDFYHTIQQYFSNITVFMQHIMNRN